MTDDYSKQKVVRSSIICIFLQSSTMSGLIKAPPLLQLIPLQCYISHSITCHVLWKTLLYTPKRMKVIFKNYCTKGCAFSYL